MKTLKTIENRVLAVLKEYPEARNDDMKLYLLVSEACIYAVSYTHLDVYKRQVRYLRLMPTLQRRC